MGTHIIYSVGIGSIEDWHNVCGEKLVLRNLGENITMKDGIPVFETSYLENLSPFYSKSPTFQSTITIDNYMQEFIMKSCEINDDELKKQYYEAFYGILRASTSLNVIPEGSTNYILYHQRVEELILQTLIGLSDMSIMDVISLFNSVVSNDIKKVMKSNNNSTLKALLILAMIKDDNSHDYDIFTSDTKIHEPKINDNALISLLNEKLSTNFSLNYQDYKIILENDPFEKAKAIKESRGNTKRLIPYFKNYARLSTEDIIQLCKK